MQDPSARRVQDSALAGPNGQKPAGGPLPEGRYPGIDRVVTGETSPLKRALDITVGGLMIGILWPVFALAAALIKMESPGPVLIKQDRVGLNGGVFRF
ncbi:MAG TPA: sugar transferase, partial [Dehalococcoidia bacterium]